MQIKQAGLVLAALATMAAGSAQAAMDNTATGNSTVIFAAHNPTDQMTLVIDLGIRMADLARNGTTNGALTTQIVQNGPISWNFGTDTVSGASITGNWSTIYSVFANATTASEFTWAVMAGDQVSAGTLPSQGWLTSGNATAAQMAAVTTNGNTGSGITALANMIAHVQNNANVLVGNHLTVDNGASITQSGTSYGALGGNLSGRQTWNSLVANGVTTTMQQLVAATNPTVFQIGESISNDATLNANPLLFSFDIATGTLVAAVPEPGTYALMLAGVAALALKARRRRG